jgi:hypothetical protein
LNVTNQPLTENRKQKIEEMKITKFVALEQDMLVDLQWHVMHKNVHITVVDLNEERIQHGMMKMSIIFHLRTGFVRNC